MKKIITILSLGLPLPLYAQYNNGALATGTTAEDGTAVPTGYIFSELQSEGTNVNSTAGFSANQAENNLLSDDFSVPEGASWEITSVELFMYKNGYVGSCPIVSTNVFIYDPATAAAYIFPQSVAACVNTQVLRVFNSVKEAALFSSEINKRQVYKFTVPVTGVVLPTGHYKLRFQTQAGGSHYYPAVTIPGARSSVTGDPAEQSFDNGTSWANIIDPGYNSVAAGQDLPFVINYSSTVGTRNIMSLDNRIKLYPNPAKDYFSVFLPENFNKHDLKITIKDISGKTILQMEKYREQFDISLLAKGTYMVTITDGKSINTNKLSKQ